MNEWNIQSRARTCQACGRGFDDKETYHTLLTSLKHELLRQDLCQACWKTKSLEAASHKGFISQWQAVYHVPTATASEPIQKESAETLLRKLIEANDPAHGPACFILAIMLERKRLLKVKEQFKRDGVRVFVYEHPKTGDVFTITDPNLQLSQLDEVQRDVSQLLEHGLPEKPSPQTTLPFENSSEQAPAQSSEPETANPAPTDAPTPEPTPAAPSESTPLQP